MNHRQFSSLQLVAISTFILLLGDLFAFFAALAALQEKQNETEPQTGLIVPPRIL